MRCNLQISSETANAETTAGGSLSEIEALKQRLEELQKKNLQNERRRDQAKNESESALRNATVIQETTSRYIKIALRFHNTIIIPGKVN